jgi:hypothetical protein
MTDLEEITALIDVIIELNARFCEYNGNPVLQPHFEKQFKLKSAELGAKLRELDGFRIKAKIYKEDLDRYTEVIDMAGQIMSCEENAPFIVRGTKDDMIGQLFDLARAKEAQPVQPYG